MSHIQLQGLQVDNYSRVVRRKKKKSSCAICPWTWVHQNLLCPSSKSFKSNMLMGQWYIRRFPYLPVSHVVPAQPDAQLQWKELKSELVKHVPSLAQGLDSHLVTVKRNKIWNIISDTKTQNWHKIGDTKTQNWHKMAENITMRTFKTKLHLRWIGRSY